MKDIDNPNSMHKLMCYTYDGQQLAYHTHGNTDVKHGANAGLNKLLKRTIQNPKWKYYGNIKTAIVYRKRPFAVIRKWIHGAEVNV